MSKNTYPEPSRRTRGGQPGNQNARTHGFYSKTLSPEQQEALQDAAVVDGIDQEIAVLRVKIASILENAPQNIDVLILALSLLARLLQTKQLIDKKDQHKLGEAFQNVLRNIAVPLGLLSEGYLSPAPKGASPSLTNNESRSI